MNNILLAACCCNPEDLPAPWCDFGNGIGSATEERPPLESYAHSGACGAYQWGTNVNIGLATKHHAAQYLDDGTRDLTTGEILVAPALYPSVRPILITDGSDSQYDGRGIGFAGSYIGPHYMTLAEYATFLASGVAPRVPWYDATRGSPLPVGKPGWTCGNNSTGWAYDKTNSFNASWGSFPIIWTERGGKTVATILCGVFFALRHVVVADLDDYVMFGAAPTDQGCCQYTDDQDPRDCPYSCPVPGTDYWTWASRVYPMPPNWTVCSQDNGFPLGGPSIADMYAQLLNFVGRGQVYGGTDNALEAAAKSVIKWEWVFPGTYDTLAQFQAALPSILATTTCTVTYGFPGFSWSGTVYQPGGFWISQFTCGGQAQITGGEYVRSLTYNAAESYGAYRLFTANVLAFSVSRSGFTNYAGGPEWNTYFQGPDAGDEVSDSDTWRMGAKLYLPGA